MASLQVASFIILLLPAIIKSFPCEQDYDSPVLELFVSPKLSSREDPGNITVMCVVKPFEEGFLVPFSWLVIKRNHKQIKKVQKFPLKEGVYNLTLSLTKQDFGNETSLTIVCQGSMLTHSCSNVSRTIVLSDAPLPEKRHDKDGKVLGVHEVIGIILGVVIILVGVPLSIKFWQKIRSRKTSSMTNFKPLNEYEQANPLTTA